MEYGGDTGDQITDETIGPGHGFLAEMAQQWEAAALDAVPLGVRVVLMRHGLVLGREGATFATLLPIFQRGFGGTLGRPKTWVSWIHVDDDARLALHVLDHEELSGPVVFAAPNPVTQREFAHAFGRALNKPAVLPMPPFALRLMYGERADLFLDGHRVMPRQALDSGFEFSFPAIEAALGDLAKKNSSASFRKTFLRSGCPHSHADHPRRGIRGHYPSWRHVNYSEVGRVELRSGTSDENGIFAVTLSKREHESGGLFDESSSYWSCGEER